MEKEEYYNRIKKINNKLLTDRVSKDEQVSLICQKNYLRGWYIDNLETQLKKQKEIIDKAVEYVKENVYENDNGCGDYWWEIEDKEKILSILEKKEV